MSDTTDEDIPSEYKVGYGRPPKGSRFKPGVSGNPRGRPKGAKGTKSILRKELNEKVVITENGRKRTLTKHELLIKRLTAEAIRGNLRAIRDLSTLAISLLGPEDENPRAAGELTSEDNDIIASFLKRQTRGDDERE